MKHTTRSLLKFKKLQRRLGFSKARDVIGLLEAMWHLTQRECPRGDIGRLDDECIAIELEWDDDPALLITSLVETGWLDECSEHRLVVHDWAEHAPRFVHGVATKKGGIITGAKQSGEHQLEADCSDPLQSTTIVDVETHISEPLACAGTTIPNLTIPNQNKKPADEFPKSGLLDTPRFQAAWDRWGRHLLEAGKPMTQTSSTAQLMEVERTTWDVDECIAAIDYTIRVGAKNLILNGNHKQARDAPHRSQGGRRKVSLSEGVLRD